jgi:hypothetical protein
MRRTCLMMLVISTGAHAASADDNPFSRPKLESPARSLLARLPDSPENHFPAPILTPPDTLASSESLEREVPVTGSGPSENQSLVASVPLIPAVRESESMQLDSDNTIQSAQSASDDESGDKGKRNPLFGPSIYGENRLARIVGDRIAIPSLIAPTTDVSNIGSKDQPEDIGGAALVDIVPLAEGFDRNQDWSLTSYFWQAPNTFSHPLYFEDPMLERHGHERFPALTPITSGARFFATIPLLPYLGAVQEPCDCVYTLGQFRAGSCAPTLLKRPPYERRAALIQAATTAGISIGFP